MPELKTEATTGSSIAVILPAFNEEATVAATILAFREALPEARIVVVDNASTDRTAALAAETLQKTGGNGDVIPELRRGKGNALRRAFLEVDADAYLLVDADTTYPANRARDLLAPVLAGRADMVVGDRMSGGAYERGQPRPFHGIGNRFVQFCVNFLFQARLRDVMSGYRAFSRGFVKNYPVLAEGFQVETEMTLHALHGRYRLLEIPIEYRDRPAGSVSKLSTFSDGAKVLFTIAQILRYYRPLLFFGILAVVFAVAGLVAGAPVMDDWVKYRYIYHVPLAILATGLEIMAAMALAIGLILDSIAHQHSRGDEKDLLRSYRR